MIGWRRRCALATPLLVGREGDWPFAGYFRGRSGVAAWAGCVAADAPPDVGWRAAMAVGAALLAGGPPKADRRRALAILWSRLDAVDRAALGPAGGADLTLLLVATDDEGDAVSGVGLGGLWAVWGERAEGWVAPPHPLLGDAGLPSRRPGALTVDVAPELLVATTAGRPVDLAGARRGPLRERCGVWT